jgi:hypothetical protein
MSRTLSLAGFQVTLIGRIWVTPEELSRPRKDPFRIAPFTHPRRLSKSAWTSYRRLASCLPDQNLSVLNDSSKSVLV